MIRKGEIELILGIRRLHLDSRRPGPKASTKPFPALLKTNQNINESKGLFHFDSEQSYGKIRLFDHCHSFVPGSDSLVEF